MKKITKKTVSKKVAKKVTSRKSNRMTCLRCKELLPIADYRATDKTSTGFCLLCRGCERIEWNEYITATRPEGDYKECLACGYLRQVSKFGKVSRNRDGLNTRCKDCIKNPSEIARRWNLSDGDSFVLDQTIRGKEKNYATNYEDDQETTV